MIIFSRLFRTCLDAWAQNFANNGKIYGSLANCASPRSPGFMHHHTRGIFLINYYWRSRAPIQIEKPFSESTRFSQKMLLMKSISSQMVFNHKFRGFLLGADVNPFYPVSIRGALWHECDWEIGQHAGDKEGRDPKIIRERGPADPKSLPSRRSGLISVAHTKKLLQHHRSPRFGSIQTFLDARCTKSSQNC